MTNFLKSVVLDFGRYHLYVGDPILVFLLHAEDTLLQFGIISRNPIIEGLNWIYDPFIPGGWLFKFSFILGALCFIVVLLFFEQCLTNDVSDQTQSKITRK